MQLLLIFLFISVGSILNVSGKPFPSTDLSENSQATNATKQEVLEVYTFELVNSLTNNESLKNSSSQNKTVNNVEILIEKHISERESLQDEDLQPIDNEGKKRNKRGIIYLRRCCMYEPQMQQPGQGYNEYDPPVEQPSQTYYWGENTGYGPQELPPQYPYIQNNGGHDNVNNNNIYGYQGSVNQQHISRG